MNSSEPVKLRRFVPLLLNDRVVKWHFEDGEPQLVMQIPMRHYHIHNGLRVWIAQLVELVFVKNARILPEGKGKNLSCEFVTEDFYECQNSRVSFETLEVPVVK